jgi:aminotransferase
MVLNERMNKSVINAPMSGIRKISDAVMQMKNVVRMDLGEPDFDTPDHIKKAAINAVEAGFSHYTPGPGIPELRKAIAEKLKKENGMDYDPESEITVTCGGVGAIYSALQAILEPGDEVILTDPIWPVYLGILGILNAKPVTVVLREENGFNMIPEEIEKKITSKTKLIIINSPNNPTGGVQPIESLKAIAEIAKSRGIFVFSDESYEKLLLGSEKHLSIGSIQGMRELTISGFTLSKTYAMTGWRLGYACAGKEVSQSLRKVSLYTITHASSIIQKAAITAITGPQDCVKDMVDEYRIRCRILVDGLNALGKISCTAPQGAFYAFANIKKTGLKSEEFVMRMIKEAGVSAVNGSAFGESGEGFVRFCFANSKENIKEAVIRIAKFIKTI